MGNELGDNTFVIPAHCLVHYVQITIRLSIMHSTDPKALTDVGEKSHRDNPPKYGQRAEETPCSIHQSPSSFPASGFEG